MAVKHSMKKKNKEDADTGKIKQVRAGEETRLRTEKGAKEVLILIAQIKSRQITS